MKGTCQGSNPDRQNRIGAHSLRDQCSSRAKTYTGEKVRSPNIKHTFTIAQGHLENTIPFANCDDYDLCRGGVRWYLNGETWTKVIHCHWNITCTECYNNMYVFVTSQANIKLWPTNDVKHILDARSNFFLNLRIFKKSIRQISCRKYLLTSRMSPELKSAIIPLIKTKSLQTF